MFVPLTIQYSGHIEMNSNAILRYAMWMHNTITILLRHRRFFFFIMIFASIDFNCDRKWKKLKCDQDIHKEDQSLKKKIIYKSDHFNCSEFKKAGKKNIYIFPLTMDRLLWAENCVLFCTTKKKSFWLISASKFIMHPVKHYVSFHITRKIEHKETTELGLKIMNE